MKGKDFICAGWKKGVKVVLKEAGSLLPAWAAISRNGLQAEPAQWEQADLARPA